VYASDDWACVEPFRELVTQTFRTYDNINIVLNRPEEFQQYGRAHTKEESVQIDEQVTQMLLAIPDLNYYCFDCDDDVDVNILESGLIV